MARPIDSLDKTLIGLLGEDGRRSLADLAPRAGVSRPTAASRLTSLVGDGVLRLAGLVDAFQAKRSHRGARRPHRGQAPP